MSELSATAGARSRRRSRPGRARPRPTPPRTAAARSGSTAARSRASPPRPSAGSASAPGSASRVGYAYGTDLSEAGVAAIAARAAEAAAVADEDEFAAPPARRRRDRGARRASSDPSRRRPGAPAEVAELALTVERTALAADSRVAGVEQAVYADSAERVAIASSTGIAGEYSSSSCFAYLQALAEGDDGRETGLGFDLARGPAVLDPAAIGREGAERAAAMIGAGKPHSRSCPVVLDPTVAASFAGLIGGGLGAKRGAARALARSPTGSARRWPARPSPCTTTASTPTGSASAPFDGEGVPRRRTALIEGGAPAHLSSTTPTRPTAGRRLDRQRQPQRLSLPALGLGLQPDRRPRRARASPSFSARLAMASSSPTSPAFTPASTRSPASSRSAPLAGSIRDGELAEPLREFTIASDLVSMLRAVRAAGAESRWVPFGGSVRTPPLLIGGDDRQRRVSLRARRLRRARC